MRCKCGEPCKRPYRELRVDKIYKTYVCDDGHVTKIIVDSGSEVVKHYDGTVEKNKHGNSFDIQEAYKRNWDKAYSKTY